MITGKSLGEGFVYTGQYSVYRQRRHGNSPQVPAHEFVVCAQTHDQVGNRRLGERLSQLVSFEDLKLAAGTVLLSPYIPLLFMGEEYGETAPFLYFVSHADRELVEAVRRGRRSEFATFAGKDETPDPQARDYLRAVQAQPRMTAGTPKHCLLREFYRELVHLRKTLVPLSVLCKENLEVLGFEEEKVVFLRRWQEPARFSRSSILELATPS